MRSGWQGNTELQKRVERASPNARIIVEAVVNNQQGLIDLPDDWKAADSLSGVTALDRGGVTLDASRSTRAQFDPASTAQIITAMSRFFGDVVEIEWTDPDATTYRLDRLTAHLDPNTSGGSRSVVEFRAQLFRVTRESEAGEGGPGPVDQGFDLPGNGIEIAPISGVASADVTSDSAQDFTFQFGDDEFRPRTGFGPTNGDRSQPRTFLRVWAVDSDGNTATDVAWLGDDTSNGIESLTNGTARHLDLSVLGGAFGSSGARFTTEVVSGMPRFTLESRSFGSSATVSFTSSSNRVDLGSSPDANSELEVVATGEKPSGTSLTWELKAPSDASWTEVADGDVIGEDNTDSGGNDLSSFSRRQDYDARVTLAPDSTGFAAPIARVLGVRELDIENLDGLTEVSGGRWSMDPIDLTGEISEATISINRGGIQDYRDSATELFSNHHIGEMEFRIWVGHPDLDRQDWLHIDTYLVEDYNAEGVALEIVGVSPASVLKTAIPPITTKVVDGEEKNVREPVEYNQQSLKSVYDDLRDSQIALPARHRGPGVQDTTSQPVTRTIEDSEGKEELDAIAHLAGGVVITSQGRVKFQPIFNDTPPHEAIPLEEASVRTLTPGYRSRVDEFFVPYGWDPEAGQYVGETRSFHGPALTKLGRARIDVPGDLDDTVARWLPVPDDEDSSEPDQNLAAAIAKRTTTEFGTGLPMVEVDSSYPKPHLEPGDSVAVQTDKLVLRDPNTDDEIRGVLWLIGTVMEVADPWGKRMAVWVRKFADVLPTQETKDRDGFAKPRVISAELSVGDDGSVDMVVNVDAEASAIRYATSTSSFPSKSTTQSGTLQATTDGSASVSSIASIDPNETLFVGLLAYENSDGSGSESPRVHKTRTVSRRLANVVSESTEESDFDADGTVEGRLTITVIAGSGSYDVQFETRQGRGTTWTTASNPTGLLNGNTTSQDVELIEGKLSFIAYEVFEGGTATSLGRRVVAFDPDDVAEVNGLSATIDDSSKNVLVSASGDSDTDSIHVRVALNSDPVDPDGTASDDGTISARTGTVDTGVTAGDRDTAHVKARGENTAGELGPVKEARVALGSGALEPVVDEQATQVGSTGKLDLTIEDIDTRVNAVEFQKKTDESGFSGTWSTAWDRSTGTAGSSSTLTRGEDIALTEKHNVAIKWRVRWTDVDGNEEIIGGTVPYDVDEIAEVRSVNASIDPDTGTLTAEAAGDDDTATIYLTHTTDGSEPSDPTSSNQDETINARSGSVTFSGVTVPKGEEAVVKARGENSNGQIAPAGTVKVDRQKRKTPVSTVNLLGEDAGPTHSGTSGLLHFYLGGPGLGNLDLLRASVGDTLSAAAEVKSATGADSVRIGIEAYTASDTLVGSKYSSGVSTSSFTRVAAENFSIPANTSYIKVFAQNQDTTEQASSRRAILNKGPVAAPYSEPPFLDAENLLWFDALAEHSGTTSIFKTYQGPDGSGFFPLSDMGLSPGDPLSISALLKSDTGADSVDIRVEFWDGSGVVGTLKSDQVTSSSYKRAQASGLIPSSATRYKVLAVNSDTTETGFSQRAMLNRGSRAAPFSGPDFKWDRDDWGGVDQGTLDDVGFTGPNMVREAGDTVTVADVSFAGGQLKVEHSGDEYELYTYDPDTSTLGGVAVGARKSGTGTGGSAGDFTLRVGPEDITVSGGENTGLTGSTTTWVGYDRTNDNLITDQSNRENALGKDIIFLGSITSVEDDSTGTGAGSENTDQGTLK